MCCCVLHNVMRLRYPRAQNQLVDQEDTETGEVIPGAWRDEDTMVPLQVLRGNNVTNQAKAQREYLMKYYTSRVGRVAWQDRMI